MRLVHMATEIFFSEQKEQAAEGETAHGD
jgi:hypothetical protein